ncbi:uncharacterized protein EI90DRAFT_3043935, partial [Cantharellus anzutake]|uniref:uncharacterized protein n=1 Tax=Cantharellus anzutake TaxID=1750568 RepID=UPI0019056D56
MDSLFYTDACIWAKNSVNYRVPKTHRLCGQVYFSRQTLTKSVSLRTINGGPH